MAVAYDGDLAVEVVAVVTVVTVVAVVGFGTVDVVVVGNFWGEVFFFFPPLTTWVQPSSSLSEWSLVPGLGFSPDDTVVAAATAAIVVVVVAVGVVVLVVF